MFYTALGGKFCKIETKKVAKFNFRRNIYISTNIDIERRERYCYENFRGIGSIVYFRAA